MSNKEMKLIMENWRGFINEEEQQAPELKAFTAKLFQDLTAGEENLKNVAVAAMEKAKVKAGQTTNEGELAESDISVETIQYLGYGLLASLPQLLNYASKAAKAMGKVEKAEEIKKWSETVHHTYQNALIKLLKFVTVGLFGKLDIDKQKQIADLIFMCIVAFLLKHAGMGAMHIMSASTLGAKIVAGIEAILAFTKTQELIAYLSKNINQILGIGAAAVSATAGIAPSDAMQAVKSTVDYAKAGAGAATTAAKQALGRKPVAGVDQSTLTNLGMTKAKKAKK